MSRLAILGGGSWGTALAAVLSARYERVGLWAREPEIAEAIRTERENPVFLPGVKLGGNIEATPDMGEAIEGAGTILGVMPSRHARAVWGRVFALGGGGAAIVSATKGLETETLLRMSEVIREAAQEAKPAIAVLSGPTFALEVARGEPAALVIASTEAGLARRIQREFSGPTFRLYTNPDPVGVEIGAALKNVIAIAAGVCQGLGLGSNTMAALITRGLAEITRLALAMGGQQRTMAGLAGLGDLVLTCTGALSRNRSVGIGLGQGRRLGEIVESMKMVAEGVDTTGAAVELGTRHGVYLPIISQMDRILRGEASPGEALRELMERSLKEE